MKRDIVILPSEVERSRCCNHKVLLDRVKWVYVCLACGRKRKLIAAEIAQFKLADKVER